MLAVEVFKVFRGVSPRFIEVFPFKESVSCDLRRVSQFETMLKAPIKIEYFKLQSCYLLVQNLGARSA